MSMAMRAPCVDSTWFVVAALLRWAEYMTVMRTIITVASTVSVISISTSEKPRRTDGIGFGTRRLDMPYRLR